MSKNKYTEEFKSEAMKQVTEEGYSVIQVSKSLGVSDVTLYAWLKKAGWKSGDSKQKQDLNTAEQEIKKLKAELKRTKEERDILKKAAAYFAKESL